MAWPRSRTIPSTSCRARHLENPFSLVQPFQREILQANDKLAIQCLGTLNIGRIFLTPAAVILFSNGGGQARKELRVRAVLGLAGNEFLEK